jgi:hypothetical protein
MTVLLLRVPELQMDPLKEAYSLIERDINSNNVMRCITAKVYEWNLLCKIQILVISESLKKHKLFLFNPNS